MSVSGLLRTVNILNAECEIFIDVAPRFANDDRIRCFVSEENGESKKAARKTALLTPALLFLTGSGKPQAVTQAAAGLQQTANAESQRGTPVQPADELTVRVFRESPEQWHV